MLRLRRVLIWAGLAVLIAAPVIVAAQSEYLAYRNAIYVVASFAGIIALAALLIQPLVAAALLPRIPLPLGRRVHRWIGALLLAAIGLHVGGLWFTSPPDMMDALTFTAPTVFSAFGVIAMWALVVAACLAVFRKRLPLRPQIWRSAHTIAAATVVLGSVVHALLITGIMGQWSKGSLSVAVVAGLLLAVAKTRPWVGTGRRERG